MNNKERINAIKQFAGLFPDAFRELSKNDPLRMAGATAFFTSFALPPILIILLLVLGLFFDPNAIRKQLFIKLAGILGRESVHQLVQTLIAFKALAQNWYITVGGFIFLLFVATTLFKVIKSSLNQVWKIKIMHKKKMGLRLRTRLQSVIIIMMAGVMFIVGIIMEAAQGFLGKYVKELSPVLALYYNNVFNFIISVIVATLWLAMVFRYLPDGRPGWKVSLTGAFFTSILFNCGKLVLRYMLGHSNIDTLYGASGSIVLILLFVFYSSLILYYGAAFTKIWALYRNTPIMPLPHASRYQLADDN